LREQIKSMTKTEVKLISKVDRTLVFDPVTVTELNTCTHIACGK